MCERSSYLMWRNFQFCVSPCISVYLVPYEGITCTDIAITLRDLVSLWTLVNPFPNFGYLSFLACCSHPIPMSSSLLWDVVFLV